MWMCVSLPHLHVGRVWSVQPIDALPGASVAGGPPQTETEM